MKVGHHTVEDVSEFVREWTGPGDPTGLMARLDDAPKPKKRDLEEREPTPAREAIEKE